MSEGQSSALVPVPGAKLEINSRATLIREALVFQLKLAIDGLKDFVLVPVVFIALGLDLAAPGRQYGANLRRVFRMGHRFDRFLDLYKGGRGPGEMAPEDAGGFDAHLAGVESFVLDELEKGELSSKAKQALREMLAARQSRE